jgi:hypothetical protein
LSGVSGTGTAGSFITGTSSNRASVSITRAIAVTAGQYIDVALSGLDAGDTVNIYHATMTSHFTPTPAAN